MSRSALEKGEKQIRMGYGLSARLEGLCRGHWEQGAVVQLLDTYRVPEIESVAGLLMKESSHTGMWPGPRKELRFCLQRSAP